MTTPCFFYAALPCADDDEEEEEEDIAGSKFVRELTLCPLLGPIFPTVAAALGRATPSSNCPSPLTARRLSTTGATSSLCSSPPPDSSSSRCGTWRLSDSCTRSPLRRGISSIVSHLLFFFFFCSVYADESSERERPVLVLVCGAHSAIITARTRVLVIH